MAFAANALLVISGAQGLQLLIGVVSYIFSYSCC